MKLKHKSQTQFGIGVGLVTALAGYTEDISASSAQWLPGSNDEFSL